MKRKPNARPADDCPCGLPARYVECCGRYIDALAPAPTAEALMRSRYTAYSLGRVAYLLATWHAKTRPGSLDLEPQPKWLGLQILDQSQVDADHATVSFVARYKLAGRAFRMQETSRFERLDKRWYYLDGQVDPPET